MNVQHLMLCFVIDYITPAVKEHGRGTRLGTCLVQLQCVSCATASATRVAANKLFVLHFITHVVHGHGRGTRLGTCLVQLQCVSCVAASIARVAANKFFVLNIVTLVHGHGRCTRLGTCFVEQQCVSCVHTLQHVLVVRWRCPKTSCICKRCNGAI